MLYSFFFLRPGRPRFFGTELDSLEFIKKRQKITGTAETIGPKMMPFNPNADIPNAMLAPP